MSRITVVEPQVPSGSFAMSCPSLRQTAQDLEHEEWVAVGLLGDLEAQLLGQTIRTERILEQACQVLRTQAREFQA